MKKLKETILLFVLAMSLALMLTACGNKTNGDVQSTVEMYLRIKSFDSMHSEGINKSYNAYYE